MGRARDKLLPSVLYRILSPRCYPDFRTFCVLVFRPRKPPAWVKQRESQGCTVRHTWEGYSEATWISKWYSRACPFISHGDAISSISHVVLCFVLCRFLQCSSSTLLVCFRRIQPASAFRRLNINYEVRFLKYFSGISHPIFAGFFTMLPLCAGLFGCRNITRSIDQLRYIDWSIMGLSE